MNQRAQAIRFWEEVAEAFPHPRVAEWLRLLKEDERGDWFRNGGLAPIAVSENSRNSRGFWSAALQAQNDARFASILNRHPVAEVFQS